MSHTNTHTRIYTKIPHYPSYTFQYLIPLYKDYVVVISPLFILLQGDGKQSAEINDRAFVNFISSYESITDFFTHIVSQSKVAAPRGYLEGVYLKLTT